MTAAPERPSPKTNMLAPSSRAHRAYREARQQYLHAGVPLYRAALRGDWTAAQTIIMEDKKILHAAITIAGETVLHVAAGAKDVHFVKQLLDLMDEAEVELQDCNGNTAFCLAVVSGSVEIVMIWMEKNTELPLIPGGRGNKRFEYCRPARF
ncbi:hypothetical protein L484_005982 [Morus notabilis]|uniref:Uncharacterized protein n=1 Tax=Morus notabilis TaxID=981085 RepID=W9SHF5_9ROSA|nr:hypothetical protein L484_005982 [Morus notabilis]